MPASRSVTIPRPRSQAREPQPRGSDDRRVLPREVRVSGAHRPLDPAADVLRLHDARRSSSGSPSGVRTCTCGRRLSARNRGGKVRHELCTGEPAGLAVGDEAVVGETQQLPLRQPGKLRRVGRVRHRLRREREPEGRRRGGSRSRVGRSPTRRRRRSPRRSARCRPRLSASSRSRGRSATRSRCGRPRPRPRRCRTRCRSATRPARSCGSGRCLDRIARRFRRACSPPRPRRRRRRRPAGRSRSEPTA